MLKFSGVGYRYASGSRDVLSSVSFSVAAGEMVALMGPSGSGKSTLLSLAGGLLRPTRGQLSLASMPANRTSSTASWIFQANWMVPRRSARDNVALAALYQGASWRSASELAAEHLDKLGLGHRAQAAMEELSGGEIQRTAVARAFLQAAPTVLADEPTAQLDLTNATLVMDALAQLAQSGRSILVATHDNDIAGRCDRVIRLRDGAVVSDVPR